MGRSGDAFRLAEGGRLIDRAKPIAFFLDGESLLGLRGDTLASALLANGKRAMGLSDKLRRPRGLLTAGPEEPNGVFDIDEGAGIERGRAAPTVVLRPGLKAFTPSGAQSPSGWRKWAGAAFDRAGGPRRARSAAAPDGEDFHLTVDVLVVGGGVAGLAAARSAAACGARVLLAEQSGRWGGRLLSDGGEIGGAPAEAWLSDALSALSAAENATLRLGLELTALDGAQDAVLHERPAPPGPGHRYWRIRAGRILLAAGSVERPLLFADNDLQGVMTARAVRDYLGLYGVAPGRQAVIATQNDEAYRTAIALAEAGLPAPLIVDQRPSLTGDLPSRARDMGLEIRTGAAVQRAIGRRADARLEAVEIAPIRASGRPGAAERASCDLLAVSGGAAPALRLFGAAGGAVTWDPALAALRPDPEQQETTLQSGASLLCIGAANGAASLGEALADSHAAGLAAAKAAGRKARRLSAPKAAAPAMQADGPFLIAPAAGAAAGGERHLVDQRSDATLADFEGMAGARRAEPERLRAAMSLCVGGDEAAAATALAVLADVSGRTVDAVAADAGSAAFQRAGAESMWAPAGFSGLRVTPIQGWHEARGAVFGRQGEWRAALCFARQSGPDGEMEDREEASIREVRSARQAVGLYDASGVRKLMAGGPEAGRLLDRLCAWPLSGLPAGRCACAVVCDDGGPVIAEVVAVRLSPWAENAPAAPEAPADPEAPAEPEAYLLFLPQEDAPKFEARLRTAQAGLSAYLAEVTDAWAQFSVMGPKSWRLLEALSDLDLAVNAPPPMGWVDTRVAGCPARVFRIARSGGAGFEIAVPSAYALSLWESLFEAGRAHGIAPIGTAAHDALRLENGVPALGREADGAATPEDLGLGPKSDEGDRPGRRAMVGLESEDPDEPLPEGAPIYSGARFGRPKTGASDRPQQLGRVTSSRWSPTLGRAVALGLVVEGRARMGQTVCLPAGGRKVMRARIVEPVFYRPDAAPSDPSESRSPESGQGEGEGEG